MTQVQGIVLIAIGLLFAVSSLCGMRGAFCRPTISVKMRRNWLKQACYSPRRERWHVRRCQVCGKVWMENQWHARQGETFTCGDAVTLADYEAIFS